MADESKNSYPVIPSASWWKLREQFVKSIPGTITSVYLASVLGMTESSARTNVFPSLKMLGFVDNEGKTNQELVKKFRDDHKYKEFCDELINKVYPTELGETFPDATVERSKVANWFMRTTGVGENGANKMATFYLLLKVSDLAKKKENITSSQKPTKKEKVIKPNLKAVKPTTPENPKDQPKQQRSSDLPSLNINIQIHISSDATPDQVDQIFSSMAKHIYKKEDK